MAQVPVQLFGEPQNLEIPERYPVNHVDSYVQRVREENALYGVMLENIEMESVFLSCKELLGLAAFVAKHRAWFETFAQVNRETFENTAVPTGNIHLRKKNDHTMQTVVSLETQNRFAWYGTAFPTGGEERGSHTRGGGSEEFLRTEWEENEDSMHAIFPVSAAEEDT